MDIKSAFRLLPIHPEDFCHFGFQFKGGIYMNICLLMGCSASSFLFEAFSTFLQWVAANRSGWWTLVHYLDDFSFVGRAGSGDCLQLLRSFMSVCAELGIPLAHEKTEGPSSVLTFLVVDLDMVRGCSCLSLVKLEKLQELIGACLSAKRLFLRKLQVIICHLNFACHVVAPGRAFLCRLCDSLSGVHKQNHGV